MNEFLDRVLFTVGLQEFTNVEVISGIVLCALAIAIYQVIVKRYFLAYSKRHSIQQREAGKTTRNLKLLFYLLALFLLFFGLDLKFIIYGNDSVQITSHMAFGALIILQLARIIDWIISRFIIHNYYEKRDLPRKDQSDQAFGREETASRTVQYAVYVFALILIIQNFQLDSVLFEIPMSGDNPPFSFKISSIFIIFFIFLVAKLTVWLITQILLYGYIRKKELNPGERFTINQLVRYVVYVIAVVMAIDYIGINTTIIWGGAAALMVGVGFGLQQTFNDFFSGIILLFERSVEVGHVVEIGGLIGTVRRIGLRTSQIETIDNVNVIVPNGKLVSNNVVNWSHTDDKVRYKLSLDVAYGSDTKLVEKILMQVASENKFVLKNPGPIVIFQDFGESGLAFNLHFWSSEFVRHERTRSELRFEIDRLFRENGVTIPFPQRDVWIRKGPADQETRTHS